MADVKVNTSQPAKYVRIELAGDRRILTLAEVEVISDGKNIATGGKATQSTTHGGAGATRAIDGNKSSDWNKGGQTHTQNSGEKAPWWELDLGVSYKIDQINIVNRQGFENRLDGFTLSLLDADRKPVFQAKNIASPEMMEINIKDGGKLKYLAYNGKAGKPSKNGPGAPASSKPKDDPTLVEVQAVAAGADVEIHIVIVMPSFIVVPVEKVRLVHCVDVH